MSDLKALQGLPTMSSHSLSFFTLNAPSINH
jgi:hypothetical protein